MQTGILYVVATPIGNLADISYRAIETLKLVDIILAEDTRHSRSLLQHYHIQKPLWALHEHNERDMADKIIEQCQQGKSFALISDAGTPLISDPGFNLVRALRLADITVSPIPGACAVIAALSAAGLPTDHFTFAGFLPAKSGARQQQLLGLQTSAATTIFYEAPHRIVDCVQDIVLVLGKGRWMVLAKELTKQFETIISGAAATILQWLLADPLHQKGEFVVLISGNPVENSALSSDILINSDKVLEHLLTELPIKQAVQLAVKITGHKKNALYERALQLKGDAP